MFEFQALINYFQINVQDVSNDPLLRNLKPSQRKCIFPDEAFESAYAKYSYSVCTTECIKRAQLNACNCTHFNYIVDENDKTPECDYYGLICLENTDFIFPSSERLQPWRSNNLNCNCLPSCNEAQIKVVGKSSTLRDDTHLRKVSIKVQSLPSHRYYRQVKRDTIDIFGNFII